MTLEGQLVARSVVHMTLGFDSGHHIGFHEIELHLGLCAHSVQSASDSLSLSSCRDEPWVLYGNSFDDKLYLKKRNP